MTEEKKIHPVDWQTTCTSLYLGGLGIGKLSAFNNVLVGKWLWRFAHESYQIWKWIIAVKSGVEEGSWTTHPLCIMHGVGVWKAIRPWWGSFSRYVAFSVGEDLQVRYLHDEWCVERALAFLFPDLFHLTIDREAMVSEYMVVADGGVHWNLIFGSRNSFWIFFKLLYSIKIHVGMEDKMYWKLNKNEFLVFDLITSH